MTISLRLLPHSLYLVQLTVELGEEYCLVSLAFNIVLHSSFLIPKVIMIVQYCPHVLCFHSCRVDASFGKNGPQVFSLSIWRHPSSDHFLPTLCLEVCWGHHL